MVKRYRLLKWYPELPDDWEPGMILILNKYSYTAQLLSYTKSFISKSIVESYPEWFEKVED